MSLPDDDGDEMTAPALRDQEIEAYLAGEAIDAAGPLLAAFAGDVATVASQPAPPPDPAVLGRFLSRSSSRRPAPVELAARPTPSPAVVADPYTSPPLYSVPTALAPRPAPLRPVVAPLRRRAGVGAAVALAAALSAASVAVAGTTDSLPDPAQRVFATVVEAVTPFEVPRPAPSKPASGTRTGIDTVRPPTTATPARPGSTPGRSPAQPGPPVEPGDPSSTGNAGPPGPPFGSGSANPPGLTLQPGNPVSGRPGAGGSGPPSNQGPASPSPPAPPSGAGRTGDAGPPAGVGGRPADPGPGRAPTSTLPAPAGRR